MQVKEAVAVAKEYLAQVFSDEGISDLGLEEVEYDDEKKAWSVTLGFSRPWDKGRGLTASILNPQRSYKVVTISDANSNVLSVKSRQFTVA